MSAANYANMYLRRWGVPPSVIGFMYYRLPRILQYSLHSQKDFVLHEDSLPAEAIVSSTNQNPDSFRTELRQRYDVVVNVQDITFVCFKELEFGPIGTE